MQKFERFFGPNKARIIGMIHANALPGEIKVPNGIHCKDFTVFSFLKGTPNYKNDFNRTIEKVQHEAHIYKKHNVVSGK